MGFRQFGTFTGSIGSITRDQFFRKPVVFYDKVTFEWSTNRIVIEDGTIKGFLLIIGSDMISTNWDGSDPLVLNVPNAITAGYAFDASLGTAQFAANLFIGTDTSYIAINGIGGGSDAIVFHDEQGAAQAAPLVDAFIVHDVSDAGGGIDNGLLWLNSFVWSSQDGAAMLLHGTSNTGTSPANVSFHIGGSEKVQINKLALNPGADDDVDFGESNLRWKTLYADHLDADGGATFGNNITLRNTAVSMTIWATDGFGSIEVGGSDGAFIDFKNAESDDFDIRFILTSNDTLQLRGGKLHLEAGSQAAPTLSFQSQTQTGIYYIATSKIGFSTGGSPRMNLGTGLTLAGAFDPGTSNIYDFGTSSLYWNDINADNFFNRSDRRIKHDIRPITLGSEFVYALRPRSFEKIADGEAQWWEDHEWDGYNHTGFIAQEVRALLEEQGHDADKMGLYRPPYRDDHEIEPFGEGDEINYTPGLHALAYEQFIAPLVATVQEQNDRLIELENHLTNCPNCARLDPPTTHGDSHAPTAS